VSDGAPMRLAIPVLLTALAGCGGFDAEYDCEQTVACIARLENRAPGDTEVNQCVSVAENQAAVADDAQNDTADDVFGQCEGETECAYLRCMCDGAGNNSDDCTKVRAAP